jgi:hypothetical protein
LWSDAHFVWRVAPFDLESIAGACKWGIAVPRWVLTLAAAAYLDLGLTYSAAAADLPVRRCDAPVEPCGDDRMNARDSVVLAYTVKGRAVASNDSGHQTKSRPRDWQFRTDRTESRSNLHRAERHHD